MIFRFLKKSINQFRRKLSIVKTSLCKKSIYRLRQKICISKLNIRNRKQKSKLNYKNIRGEKSKYITVRDEKLSDCQTIWSSNSSELEVMQLDIRQDKDTSAFVCNHKMVKFKYARLKDLRSETHPFYPPAHKNSSNYEHVAFI